MAHIKCRYWVGTCLNTSGECYDRDIVDQELQCEYGCPHYSPKETRHEGAVVIGAMCEWYKTRNIEFEKSVRRYEYDEYQLRIGMVHINAYQIEYLEIDGRVLIGEDDQE